MNFRKGCKAQKMKSGKKDRFQENGLKLFFITGLIGIFVPQIGKNIFK